MESKGPALVTTAIFMLTKYSCFKDEMRNTLEKRLQLQEYRSDTLPLLQNTYNQK
jgi:hypothetical protein